MGERGSSKGDVRRGSTARRAMEKSRYVRVIEGKEVRGDDPIEYFLSTGLELVFESQRVMAIEVPQNEQISG